MIHVLIEVRYAMITGRWGKEGKGSGRGDTSHQLIENDFIVICTSVFVFLGSCLYVDINQFYGVR